MVTSSHRTGKIAGVFELNDIIIDYISLEH